LTLPIVSLDERENFLLDINRGRIKLSKCTYQNRYRSVIHLVRLDVDGSPHQNPFVEKVPLPDLEKYNGTFFDESHLHLYVEGFDDRWAIPAPPEKFRNVNDLWETLTDFFVYCNIIEPPSIRHKRFFME